MTVTERHADPGGALSRRVRAYWNSRIHDLEMTAHPVGSLEFFDDLDAYRFDKLAYLPRVVAFDGYRSQRLLEIGCGIGTDLVRFARGGARVSGVDLSETAVGLARRNMALHGLRDGVFAVADGASRPVPNGAVDVVCAHGVLQYSAEPQGIVSCIWAYEKSVSGREHGFRKYSVLAELDLHGRFSAEARITAGEFLHRCSHRAMRCVRIIHGKGHGSRYKPPVLKTKLNHWLQHNDLVLAFCSARRVDGGSGAIYVLLRKT